MSVNLIHDIDLMRHFCGEVVAVQAQFVSARRGYENEDLASAILRFAKGVIGTVSVSEASYRRGVGNLRQMKTLRIHQRIKVPILL